MMSSEPLISAVGVAKTYSARPIGIINPWRPSRPELSKAALTGIDLVLYPQETLGLVGDNGAGKTTLLSVLAGVIIPTSGIVRRRGRTVSLLGLGPSFQPELSGRDNADLQLRIAGLTNAEIRNRMPEIEQFAEIGSYFDVPVRTYSSGMRARVAFATAIQVRAETFLIDETLAVGDIEFRQKCYSEIRSLQDAGHAFILVSHSLALIRRICTRVILLKDGCKIFDGNPTQALAVYESQQEAATPTLTESQKLHNHSRSGPVQIRKADYQERIEDKRPVGTIIIELTAISRIEMLGVGVVLRSKAGVPISTMPLLAVPNCGPMPQASLRVISVSFSRYLLTGVYVVDIIAGDMSAGGRVSTFPHLLRLDVLNTTKAYGFADLSMTIDLPPRQQAPVAKGLEGTASSTPR